VKSARIKKTMIPDKDESGDRCIDMAFLPRGLLVPCCSILWKIKMSGSQGGGLHLKRAIRKH